MTPAQIPGGPPDAINSYFNKMEETDSTKFRGVNKPHCVQRKDDERGENQGRRRKFPLSPLEIHNLDQYYRQTNSLLS